jgi:hypothetical protein
MEKKEFKYTHPDGLVELNGTGYQALFEEACAAGKALESLRLALRDMTIHGRDFSDTETLRTSQAEHRIIQGQLKQVEEYVAEKVEHTFKARMALLCPTLPAS